MSTQTARSSAELRIHLRSLGKNPRSRALDILIAATAIEHNLTLVTRNIEDFSDIPGLNIYGHEAPAVEA